MNNGSIICGFALLVFQQRWAQLFFGSFTYASCLFSLLQGLVCTVIPPDFQAVIGFVQSHQQVCEVRNKAQISTVKASPTKQDRGSAEGCSCLQLPLGTILPHQHYHRSCTRCQHLNKMEKWIHKMLPWYTNTFGQSTKKENFAGFY